MLERTFQFRGTVLDLPPDEAGDDYWSYVQNIFFRDRATQRIWGYEQFYNATGEMPVFCYPVQRRAAPLWLIVTYDGTNTKVIRWSGTSAVVISTGQWDGVDGRALDWQATDHNGIIVLNASHNRAPVWWNETIAGPNGGGQLEDLPGWPVNVTCRSIRSFKFHLFALNLQNLTQENDYEFMWSDASEPNTIPQSWTAAAETDAGNAQLASPQGHIVDGIVLRDALVIFKDFSAHLVQYTGGVFVFNQRHLYISAGMMNPRCAVELNGRAMVATQDDIILTDGNSMESVCTHEVRRYIFNNINAGATRYCQMVKRHIYDEVLFAYPKAGSTYCNEAAIYNTRTRRWGFVPLPNVSCLSYGLVPDTGFQGEWDQRNNNWDTDTTRWDEQGYNNTADEVVMCAPNIVSASEGKVFVNNRGSTADGNPIYAEVKREGVLLSPENPEYHHYLNELWPQIIGRAGDVIFIQAGASDNENDPVRWSPAVPFTIGTGQGKVDLHTSGRWMAFKFYSQGGFPWRMYNFRVRFKRRGRF